MSVFSFIPFPEDLGEETMNLVEVKGFIHNIHGQPLPAVVKAGLNKEETSYKTQFNLSGEELETTADETDGSWSLLLPDNFHMPLDSYYRFTINDVVHRKFLPDFPPQNSLNNLDDY